MRSRKYIFFNSVRSISKSSISRFVFKSITRNQHLDFFYRYFSYYNYFSNTSVISHPSRLKPVCLSTGRARGLVNAFFISRLTFKEYALQGKVFGYKRSQW